MCATCRDRMDYNKFCTPLNLHLATTPAQKNINGKIYTTESYLRAIEEYKRTRIDTGTAFLGLSKYNVDGKTIDGFYLKEQNFWNSIGIIKDIDPVLGWVTADCAYNYDSELWVVTIVYDAECIDKDADLYEMKKIKDFYLSRKFQLGMSITDGKSIREHLNRNRYPFNNIIEPDIDRDLNMVSFNNALARFKERLLDVYSMPASVIDENGNTVGLIYDITSDNLICFISRDRINRFDYSLIPICNTSGNGLEVVSVLNFKLVPKFKSKELETIK